MWSLQTEITVFYKSVLSKKKYWHLSKLHHNLSPFLSFIIHVWNAVKIFLWDMACRTSASKRLLPFLSSDLRPRNSMGTSASNNLISLLIYNLLLSYFFLTDLFLHYLAYSITFYFLYDFTFYFDGVFTIHGWCTLSTLFSAEKFSLVNLHECMLSLRCKLRCFISWGVSFPLTMHFPLLINCRPQGIYSPLWSCA